MRRLIDPAQTYPAAHSFSCRALLHSLSLAAAQAQTEAQAEAILEQLIEHGPELSRYDAAAVRTLQMLLFAHAPVHLTPQLVFDATPDSASSGEALDPSSPRQRMRRARALAIARDELGLIEELNADMVLVSCDDEEGTMIVPLDDVPRVPADAALLLRYLQDRFAVHPLHHEAQRGYLHVWLSPQDYAKLAAHLNAPR